MSWSVAAAFSGYGLLLLLVLLALNKWLMRVGSQAPFVGHILGKKGMMAVALWLVVGGLGLAGTLFGFISLPFMSVGAADGDILTIQRNAIECDGTNCSEGSDTTRNSYFYVRSDTSSYVDSTGYINGTVTAIRPSGSATEGLIVDVVMTQETFTDEDDASDSNVYTLIETDNNGIKCYIETDSYSGGASTSSPQGKSTLGFTEGESTGVVNFYCLKNGEMDEMVDYSTKNLYLSIGDQTVIVEILRTG